MLNPYLHSGSKAPFLWVTDNKKPSLKLWANGEPNNVKGQEHCVELYMNYGKLNDGKWNDNRCDLEQPYICMKRKLTNKKWTVY